MQKISALMDGESSPQEARQALARLRENKEYCQTWETFHLIGDVMRGNPPLRDDFTARLRARMEQEPTVLAPRRLWRQSAQFALSAAASLAAVAAVLTLVLTDNPLSPGPQVAAVPKSEAIQPVVTVKPAVVQSVSSPQPVPQVNQARVNEYLMAHQEYSPSTALQGVATYVRTVSARQDSNGR